MESSSKLATTSRVVVATTVALSFISYWRGAAIVLSDLASSMFYAGGIAEQAIGKSAAWYVLGVMIFSFAVRSVYIESCGMFVRGGVYVVVRDSMGPAAAKISVSALVFDYILTGPISCVSAGQYLGALINELAGFGHFNLHINPNHLRRFLWRPGDDFLLAQQYRGIEESSSAALRIMQITTVMVLILLIWCPLTIILQGKWQLPPSPVPSHLHFAPEALGWFKGTFWPSIPIIADHHRLRALASFDEWLRDPGSGLSRNRISETEKS